MRIVYFADAYHPRVSGQVTSMDEFCKSLTERGHELCIVCPAYPDERMQGLPPEHFRTIRVPSGSAIISEEDRLAIPWREKDAIRELDDFDPQVVHIQTEFTVGAMGRRYCRQRGIPILSTCHTFYEMYIHWYLPLLPQPAAKRVVRTWLKGVYAHDDAIVTPSNHIRDVMSGYGIEREYTVIPTGVDERLFFPHSEQARHFRERLEARHPEIAKGPLLAYVGRISHEKNLSLLAEAMSLVVKKAPSVHLILVGDSPHGTYFHEFFRSFGLEKNVVWTGYMPREELPVIYSAADLFVFPSITETQGLVTIEAMLCGTPVVGVNRMGSAEILEGNRGGLLSENDPADFAEKTLRLILDPALRKTKAVEAQERAKNWTIGHSCDQIESLYRRVFGV